MKVGVCLQKDNSRQVKSLLSIWETLLVMITPNNDYEIRLNSDVLIHSKKNILYLGCHLDNDLNYYKEDQKSR